MCPLKNNKPLKKNWMLKMVIYYKKKKNKQNNTLAIVDAA